MKIYDLIPKDGRKSFYGKAKVYIADDGTATLYSYNMPIIQKTADCKLVQLWNGWTATAGGTLLRFADSINPNLCGYLQWGY